MSRSHLEPTTKTRSTATPRTHDYYGEIRSLETCLLRPVVLDDTKVWAPRADLINTKHAYEYARRYRKGVVRAPRAHLAQPVVEDRGRRDDKVWPTLARIVDRAKERNHLSCPGPSRRISRR